VLTKDELEQARKLYEDACAAGRLGEQCGIPRELLGKLIEAADRALAEPAPGR